MIVFSDYNSFTASDPFRLRFPQGATPGKAIDRSRTHPAGAGETGRVFLRTTAKRKGPALSSAALDSGIWFAVANSQVSLPV